MRAYVSSALILLTLAIGCQRAHERATTQPNDASDRTAADKETQPEGKYAVLMRGNLDDLSADALAILRQIPGVASVSRDGPADTPEYRIIHLLDWHYVSKEDYAADLRSVSAHPLTDDEFDGLYEKLLNEVEQVQQEQKAFMGNRHGRDKREFQQSEEMAREESVGVCFDGCEAAADGLNCRGTIQPLVKPAQVRKPPGTLPSRSIANERCLWSDTESNVTKMWQRRLVGTKLQALSLLFLAGVALTIETTGQTTTESLADDK